MKLLFPGSFDPFTTGHADLVDRALKLADSVVIAVGVNEKKKYTFSAAQRVDAISRYYKDEPRVSVVSYTDLTVDVVKRNEADAILRGVRSMADFESERTMADVNYTLAGVETVLLCCRQDLQHVSSSLVRELMAFGKSTEGLVIDTFNV